MGHAFKRNYVSENRLQTGYRALHSDARDQRCDIVASK
jgi:hypothetical protein